MAKIISQVELPNGKIAERVSANRTYTHAVLVVDTAAARDIRVALRAVKVEAAQAKLATLEVEAAKTDATEYAKIAAAHDADTYSSLPRADWQRIHDLYFAHPRAKANFAAADLKYEQNYLEGESEIAEPGILTWCGSYDLAVKACRTESKKKWHARMEISIVAAKQVTKSAKSAVRGVAR